MIERERPAFPWTIVSLVVVLAGASACTATTKQAWPEEGIELQKPLRDPSFQATIGYGIGGYKHDTELALDGETDARVLRLTIEGTSPIGIGGGVQLEFTRTDDELFDDIGFLDTDVGIFDGFFHATFRVTTERFRMPLRIGPYYHSLVLEDSTDEITWSSFGARLQIEPEVLVHRGTHSEVGIFAQFRAGVHTTLIEVDLPLLDEEYDSEGTTIGASVGVRGRWPGVTASLAYVFRRVSNNESDVEFGTFVREMEGTVEALIAEVGLSF